MAKEIDSAEVESVADSYEFISDGEAKSLRSESSGGSLDVDSRNTPQKTSSLPSDSGVLLNSKETFLAKRVRELQQENDDLTKAIHENGEALKLCVNNLNTWKDQQRDNHNVWLEKYEQARETVTKLHDEIDNLKQQLEVKTGLSTSPLPGVSEGSKLDSSRVHCLQQENVSLLSVKSVLEEKVCCLQEHINQAINLSDDDHQKLSSPGSTFFPNLLEMCGEIENAIKLVVKPDDSSLQGQLETEKETCDLLRKSLEHEKAKRSELEKRNHELEERIKNQAETMPDKNTGLGRIAHDGAWKEVDELKEEVHLLDLDVNKFDMVTAGCVSSGTETPGESLATSQELKRQESIQSAESLEYEEEKRALKEQISKLKKDKTIMERREGELLNQREEDLTEIKELKEKLEKVNRESEQKQREDHIITELVEKHKEQEISKKNLEEQLVQCHREIDTLKSQVCSFCQEIQEKERECERRMVQEFEYQQRLQHMDVALAKVKEDLNFSQSALVEARSELASVYAQNEKLLSENQSVRGASGAEVAEYKSIIDNLTAQLLSAEELVENKEQDYRKLQQDHANVTSELETVPLLKQQMELFQTDFATERQARQQRDEECKRLNEEMTRLRAENERLMEEANDPTGSRMAELQRRHGNIDQGSSTWNNFYNQFLAPRGPPTRSVTIEGPSEPDLSRQVSGGRCPKCDRSFPDLDALQTHVVRCLESESTASSGENVCPKCQESFPDLDTLQIHVMECLDN